MGAPPLTLKIVSGGFPAPGWTDTFVVFGAEVVIGRGEKADWVLDDSENIVSKEHCVIRSEGGEFTLTDTSANGTYLNGEIFRGERRPLANGDEIGIGSFIIQVTIQASPVSPTDPAPRDLPASDTADFSDAP